jgi:glycosyl transferase family WbsX
MIVRRHRRSPTAPIPAAWLSEPGLESPNRSESPTMQSHKPDRVSINLRPWLTFGLLVLVCTPASAENQLKVVNGNFNDLTGLTEGKGGWYSGLPNGWSGSRSTYAVNDATGPTPPTCNPAALGFLRQNVGTLAHTSNVTLTFDVSEPWKAPAVLDATILDGDFVELAVGNFSTGSRQTLTAKNVPGGTSIIITFQATGSAPGLDNVSIAATELHASEQLAIKPLIAPEPPVTVGCYYFGNYHPGDPRNEKNKGPGWSEWELVKNARPRFPGHQQPKVPLWGYADESDPKAMAQKIDAAADHGIDAFIFDWYYYNDGPFLDRPIDLGFLGAENNSRIKFAFMWANCDWQEIHPYRRGTERKVLYPGEVTPETFEKICDHVIQSYFQHPSYWRIDGRPYFSFYELTKLLDGFGSVDATRAALDRFRSKAVAAGLPGLHLNAVVWGRPILPGEKKPANATKLVQDLGFDSVTSYVWVHHTGLPDRQTDYNEVRDNYFRYWNEAERKFSVPYFPNVTMGWDSSPRAHQEDEFGNFGYPFVNTIGDNTPERFRAALEITKRRLLAKPDGQRILNINCWNEWTEGSYLEPDLINGMRYLEAIRDVFPPAKGRSLD